MDLNQLKTFYHLVQTKNYSKCAKRLFVTQSAVSHAIRKLETGLDKKLIQRNGSEFALSSEGELLFESCERIFSELEGVKAKMDRINNRDRSIAVGSVVEFGTTVLLKNMTGFMDRNPEVQFDFNLMPFPLHALLDDEVDLIVDCRDHAETGLLKVRLFQEDYVIVASPDYAESMGLRAIQDLERCNLLSMDRNLLWWNTVFYALQPEQRIQCHRVTCINHVRGIINAAAASLGVGLVPRYTVLDTLNTGGLVCLFPEVKLLEDTFFIYIKKINAAVPIVRDLINHIETVKPF